MKNAAAKVIVELFGQPGAGKTTLVRAIGNSGLLTCAGLSAEWRRRSRFQKGAVLARSLLDPLCLVRATRLAVGAPLTSGDSLVRLARLVAKSHWVRSQNRGMLLEEGSLQELWSILYSSRRFEPDPGLLSPLIRSLYAGLDARIVHIDVDPETASARIAGRSGGKSRLDRLPQEALRGRLLQAAALPRRIAQAARQAGLQVETLDGSLPQPELVGRLRSILRNG